MLIKAYDVGPLVPGESLLVHPGFWSNYLLSMCRWRVCRAPGSGVVRRGRRRYRCPVRGPLPSSVGHDSCQPRATKWTEGICGEAAPYWPTELTVTQPAPIT
ncbi:hypothetical protein GCM10017674_66810 [Streptomyces gardneri]|uniref:Uncharacterized protein n=1 Tax=Streptomyces gardneri TaxID=66892 RepID=A0A4Y3RHE8_9ACTN|nr:hypothetical protein SGA01_26800 [Streptomyces gardneri]GHH16665.1 hypothetical protein GCM10017674_66810 [Streptomyces gardneri]